MILPATLHPDLPDCPVCRALLEDGSGRLTTLRAELQHVGCRPRPDGEIPPEKLFRALWELIEQLAGIEIYLLETDHLTDRELYRRLVEEVLDRQEVRAEGQIVYYGLSSTEEFWRYYADDPAREEYVRSSPEAELPERLPLVTDRDRTLPGP